MSKRNWLIFWLVLSIIILVYTCLDYAGLIRYGKIHLFPLESYIPVYARLPKPKDRVIVGFTDKSPDESGINPFLKSLLDQTVRVTEISTVRNKQDLLGNKIVSVYTCDRPEFEQNKSALTLIYTLLREPDKKTQILMLNPKYVYGRDFIQYMLEESDKDPDHILVNKGDNAILFRPSFLNLGLDYKIADFCDNPLLNIERLSQKKIRYVDYRENYRSL